MSQNINILFGCVSIQEKYNELHDLIYLKYIQIYMVLMEMKVGTEKEWRTKNGN